MCALVLFGLCADSADAHDLGTSESRIDVDGPTVRAVVYLNVAEFPDLDADRNGRISVDELDRQIADVFATVKQHYQLTAAGAAPAKIVLTRYQLADDHTIRLQIDCTFRAAVARLDVTSTLDQLTRPEHQHLVNVYAGDRHESAVLSRGRPQASFATRRPLWANRSLWVVTAMVLLGGRAAFALRQRRRRA